MNLGAYMAHGFTSSTGAFTPCALFGAELAESAGGELRLGSGQPLQGARSSAPMTPPPGSRHDPAGFIQGASLARDEVGPAIWETFLPVALAAGSYLAAP